MQATVSTKQASTEAVTRGLADLMRHLLVTTGRDFFAEMEKAGVSLTHTKSLMLLSDADEPMSVKAISDALGLSLPGVSRSIDGLVQRGELKREEDPRDRRCKLVSITPKGRRLYERLVEVRLAGVRRFVDELNENEKEGLAYGLDAVAGRIPR